ncbi:hypothetical protein PLIIFM63780_001301 [Purpureocillium lilacinum]|nr:hypothetical protein PLIIFM63780_001301 [Purpureocillium lilacinum]
MNAMNDSLRATNINPGTLHPRQACRGLGSEHAVLCNGTIVFGASKVSGTLNIARNLNAEESFHLA